MPIIPLHALDHLAAGRSRTRVACGQPVRYSYSNAASGLGRRWGSYGRTPKWRMSSGCLRGIVASQCLGSKALVGDKSGPKLCVGGALW